MKKLALPQKTKKQTPKLPKFSKSSILSKIFTLVHTFTFLFKQYLFYISDRIQIYVLMNKHVYNSNKQNNCHHLFNHPSIFIEYLHYDRNNNTRLISDSYHNPPRRFPFTGIGGAQERWSNLLRSPKWESTIPTQACSTQPVMFLWCHQGLPALGSFYYCINKPKLLVVVLLHNPYICI